MPSAPKLPWKDFERLVAHIEQETAPAANVQHNIQIIGRSLVSRQIDVAVRQAVGLHEVLIVIECKNHQAPVDIEHVEAFVAKLEDVRASEGVLVSPVGFTSGAKAMARDRGVGLRTLKEAVTDDWKAIVAAENWFRFYIVRRVPSEAELLFTDNRSAIVELDARLWYADGADAGPVRNVFLGLDHEVGGPGAPGFFELTLKPDPNEPLEMLAVVADFEGTRRAVLGATFRGEAQATEYVASAVLSGHVVRDELSSNPVYETYESSSVDWHELVNRQKGRQLTLEEWQDNIENDKIDTLMLGQMPNRYIRLEISRHTSGSS